MDYSTWQPQRRRDFLSTILGSAASGSFLALAQDASGLPSDMAEPGERPDQDDSVTVLNPRGDRVPVSFVIDDSTCLVNMAHFAMPQFGQAWPQRDSYKKDWRSWPREIPDSFVRFDLAAGSNLFTLRE